MHETIIPCATYRLQFNRDFTFADATRIVPYLHALGISHVYASPFLKARAHSPHGYDIVDHNALNPEIGDQASLTEFVAALHAHEMGLILDFVPNHMGVGGDDNRWWLDVLEHGPASRYARHFDIDWRHPAKSELRGKVLLPVLGDHYGTTLESGDITLEFDAARGEFSARYFTHRFPLDPRSYATILNAVRGPFSDAHSAQQLHVLIALSNTLPTRYVTDEEHTQQRLEQSTTLKQQLARLCRADDALRGLLQESIRRINGTPGKAQSFDRLHQLLEQQAYRLAYWRVAADEINYRRFFNINELAGIRMEDPEVFATTHQLVFQLIAAGTVDGLRIDHPDGLYDPSGYFGALQQQVAALTETAAQAPGVPRPLYLVVEKILAAHEPLPQDWPVHGTTGYDFAHRLNGLFIEPAAELKLTRVYQRFIRHPLDFDELLYRCKKLIIRSHLSAELTVLANRLNAISEVDRHTRDYTLNALREALIEVIACFPVYRTYISSNGVSDSDRRYISSAIARARARSSGADITIYTFIKELLLQETTSQQQMAADEFLDFTMHFQQYTAPVMAKGLEDTACYSYHRLISLNEVGGDPRRFGCSLAEFHRHNQERLEHWPHAMLHTSTHDSKRSEDVRARINVLSELPEEWRHCLSRWSRWNHHKKRKLDGMGAPTRNNEYLFYQTLLGIWPTSELTSDLHDALQERIESYMIKALREAKTHSSWINPNREYEEATLSFLQRVLDPSVSRRFLDDFAVFAQRIANCGMYNSLAQKLLTLTAPGVPDIYQGNELWCLQLVDPDNRRPVDFELRQRLLQTLMLGLPVDTELAAFLHTLLDTLEDGRAKHFLTWKTLNFRRDHHQIFQQGSYLPLECVGHQADHLCAFARLHPSGQVLVIAARWYAKLMGETHTTPIGETVWQDTRLIIPDALETKNYRNLYSGQILTPQLQGIQPWLPLAEILRDFPVALLYAADQS